MLVEVSRPPTARGFLNSGQHLKPLTKLPRLKDQPVMFVLKVLMILLSVDRLV
jgi:hypothetical protein